MAFIPRLTPTMEQEDAFWSILTKLELTTSQESASTIPSTAQLLATTTIRPAQTSGGQITITIIVTTSAQLPPTTTSGTTSLMSAQEGALFCLC